MTLKKKSVLKRLRICISFGNITDRNISDGTDNFDASQAYISKQLRNLV